MTEFGVRFPPGLRHMAAGAFFFSLMSLLVRIAGQDLPTMELVLSRSAVVLGLTTLRLRMKGISPWGERRGLLAARGSLGFVGLSCFYYALIHLPLADATVIQYTNPIWTALLAAVLLSERIRRWEVLLSVGSLAGVVVMARPTILFGETASALPPVPVAVALMGAVFSAAAYVTVRALGRSEDPLVTVFWFALVGTVGATPFVAANFVRPSATGAVLLLAIGLTTYGGQVLITMGLRDERAGRAMAVGYLQIVFAAVWGVLVLAEMPDRFTVAGAVVILACTWGLGRTKSEASGTGTSERLEETNGAH